MPVRLRKWWIEKRIEEIKKEIEANKVNLESRDAGQLGQMTKEGLISKLLEEIINKK